MVRYELSFGGRIEKFKKQIGCWEKGRENDQDDSKIYGTRSSEDGDITDWAQQE